MARSRIGPREPVERPADLARRRSRSRRWRPSSSASFPRATSGSTSRSGTASAACSRTARGELRLWSRNARPLLRYFPELRPLEKLLPPALGARRRDRHRARRRPRLRRDADAPASGREPRQQALGGDPRALHRLRRPRLEGRRGLARAALEAPHAPRAEREALRALPRDARSRRGARLARPLRGDRPRRRDREAPRPRRTSRARATASSR